jgi:hypothetical protein
MKALVRRRLLLTLAVLALTACSPVFGPNPTGDTEPPALGATAEATPGQPETVPEPAVPEPAVPAPIVTDTPAKEPDDKPTEEPTEEPAETPRPVITHRISIREVDGIAEFYDRQTGERFIPRGYNYVRVAPMSAADPALWHSTLNPGYYEPERAEAALQAMHAAGYNVVRIFVDCCRAGSNVGDPRGGISAPYLENVIDFLERATANGIFVLLISDLTPAQGGYDDMWQHCCSVFDGENLRYLTLGGHRGERRFNQDFIRALIERQAPLETIFAYDLTNEVHFSVDKPPFSLTSGRVTTANRQTYDMADPDDKQRMMDENLVYWINQQRAAILEVDPTALVTVSFPAINAGQTTVHPGPAVWESEADFVDLHAYLGWGLSLEQYMGRFGVDEPPEKPIILGEFGASRRAFATATAASLQLVDWQAASCAYGFDGWLLWTWDAEEQSELWHGMSDEGEINAALAPVNRPDPCAPRGP